MTDLIGWATTPTGILVQSAIALMCQIVGFGIVVLEIVESRKEFSGLVDRFREIEEELETNLANHLDQKGVGDRVRAEVRAADGAWNKIIAMFISLFISTPMSVTVEVERATLTKIHELVARDDARQHPKRPWVGAVFLLIGIVLSFTAQVSGVK